MKKNDMMIKMGRKMSIASLKLKKCSPEIMVVAGVIGLVASMVLACKATLKVNDILEDAKENIDNIHECENDETLKDKYTEKDSKKDLAIVYGKTAIKLAKLYAPAVIFGTVSVTGIFMSHNILRKRNAAVMAAYAALDRGFKQYRKNVVERYGEKTDYELLHNIKAKIIKEKSVDENGEEIETEVTVQEVAPEAHSEYARCFDETCHNWTRDPEHNFYILRSEQNYANDKLRAQGYLFLNEIYRRLGFEETPAGQVVGWLYRPDDPEYDGDSYVDFGIFDMSQKKVRDFIEGDEPSIWLDFNVDGIMYDKI